MPRHKKIQVRVSDAEYAAILKAATLDSRTISDYVRLAALEKARKDAQGE